LIFALTLFDEDGVVDLFVADNDFLLLNTDGLFGLNPRDANAPFVI
jgi:hypothetical protein